MRHDVVMTRRRAARGHVPVALARSRFPRAVLDVLNGLDAAGFRSWLVGGAVRDVMLRRQRTANDLDVATPARPEQVMALFPKVVPTGVEHGTVTVISRGVPVEVTTFRGEGAYVDGRRPSSITFLDDVDQDLARRDFTVNALAWDPVGRSFRDPFGGRVDLRRRVLRAVGDPAARFGEDGLRPLRAVRFASQLGFTLDPPTAAAIRPALPITARVSVERITEELGRLVVAPHARHGLDLLDDTGLLGVALPDLARLPAELRSHAFDVAGATKRDLTLRMAALLHVFAVGEGPRSAADRVRIVLDGMRFAGHVRDGAAALVGEHGCVLAAQRPGPPETDAEMRRWLSRVSRARAPSVLALWRADCGVAWPRDRARREGATLRAFTARLARMERGRPPLASSELALDGRAVMDLLGLGPGPVVGEALRHLLDRVLEDPRLNTAAGLTSELKGWWTRRRGPE